MSGYDVLAVDLFRFLSSFFAAAGEEFERRRIPFRELLAAAPRLEELDNELQRDDGRLR